MDVIVTSHHWGGGCSSSGGGGGGDVGEDSISPKNSRIHLKKNIHGHEIHLSAKLLIRICGRMRFIKAFFSTFFVLLSVATYSIIINSTT